MRIPNADHASIAHEKIVGYLLNLEHQDGVSKAKFLAIAGFLADNPLELEKALREQHLTLEAEIGKHSLFGVKYEISGGLTGPKGTVFVKSIWMIKTGESHSTLITLIPEKLP